MDQICQIIDQPKKLNLQKWGCLGKILGFFKVADFRCKMKTQKLIWKFKIIKGSTYDVKYQKWSYWH